MCGYGDLRDEHKESGNKYLKTISLALPYASENAIEYKNIDGSEYIYWYEHKTILNDGAIIYTYNGNGSFLLDVNGEKGPNVYGRDLFGLFLDAYGHVIDGYDVDAGYTHTVYFGGGEKIINSHRCEKDNINPLETNECFYYKIVSDGWKMNY